MPSDSEKIPHKIKPEGADGHRQRMIFKFLNSYENGFLKRDLVEILLYYAIRVRDTRDTAVRLMKDNGDDIYNILNASPEKLCRTPGIGPACTVLITVVGEIVRRLHDDEVPSEISDNRSDNSMGTVEDLLEVAKNSKQEKLYVAYHDSSSCLNSFKSYFMSMSNTLSGEVAAMLKQACLTHSDDVTIIRVTNGAPAASPWDMELFHNASRALANTDMRLAEYYIVGKNEIVKMKDMYI